MKLKTIFCCMAILCISIPVFAQNEKQIDMEYQTLSPNIGVKNVDETVTFYTETLGFNLIMSVPSPNGGLQWAMVANGGAAIMFQEMGNLTEEYPQLAERPILGAMTFYVKMKGMQSLYKKLQGTEYIAKEMHKTFYGADEFAIFDNNGHILTITEDTVEPTNEDIKTTIITLEEQALVLWNDGNPDGFLELSADDVVYFDPVFEKKFVGKKALAAYYEGFRGKNNIDSYDMIEPIVQVTPECAVLMYDYEARREGQAFRMHCTEVYKLDSSGQWKIIHTHWSFVMPNQ